jgi:hypothetical protein
VLQEHIQRQVKQHAQDVLLEPILLQVQHLAHHALLAHTLWLALQAV